MSSGKREIGESFNDYRKRLAKEEKEWRKYKRGNTFWHGSQGTYRKHIMGSVQ
jgi:hypothetical protein